MKELDFKSSSFQTFDKFEYTVTSIGFIRKKVVVNHHVALKVSVASNIYHADNEIDLLLEDGTKIGSLCTKPSNNLLDRSKLTENKYIAYLSDVDIDVFLVKELVMKSSYAVIHEDYLDLYYNKYFKTASIWGNYSHDTRHSLSSKQLNIPSITLIPDLKHSSNFHRSNSLKALLQPYCFERFLKKYHQIELLYDLEVVDRIKALKNDLIGIAGIMSDLGSNELNRLKLVLKGRITDYSAIATIAYKSTEYYAISETLFHVFSKTGDPMKSNEAEFESFMKLPSFSETDIRTLRKKITTTTYEHFIIDLISYWIYRIRSSIAHQRIGEYILTENEEDFILNFAEPLIDEVLIQIYKKQ
ncbi:hypothetical protein DSL64_03780 [Dyadobacter luteus]|uniref:Uncharacterized protein n=1 Tax=Dyadobacter luteus TaxID=2259619 RepID=A0A3D8YG01_9BACT|nr:hypothetical protein [Dyadobacter luteus]REA63573.1 hypothetical protein DSL64_03780 [Dyadobacter luteus]